MRTRICHYMCILHSSEAHYFPVVYASCRIRACIHPYFATTHTHAYENTSSPFSLSSPTLFLSLLSLFRICLMVYMRVSHCDRICGLCVCVWNLLLVEAWGSGGSCVLLHYRNWRVAHRRDRAEGRTGACVSDVLMTLRNIEQANQYGRHCMHSMHVISLRTLLHWVTSVLHLPRMSEWTYTCSRGDSSFCLDILARVHGRGVRDWMTMRFVSREYCAIGNMLNNL